MKGKTKKKLSGKTLAEVAMDFALEHIVVLERRPKECPRCGGEHNLKVKKFAKPMEFFGKDFYGRKVLTARCSHWAMCPKTKEPTVFFDRFVNSKNIEDYVARQTAADIASEIDKELLADLKQADEQRARVRAQEAAAKKTRRKRRSTTTALRTS